MKIKKVEINGFKSFMDHTVLGFDENISGIVGPNGCGKSNVVDAIRWVLGEQAPRRLRGKNMEDVIFNGSEKYGPSGMAEVVITFLNNGNYCPPMYAELSEISITRRLFRSGESEYMINRQPCRLRDVTEFFLGTGVGTRSYSIVEQGMVSDIISFKPEERRLFIEEAAGITLYRERKKIALRKMDQTKQNLTRIDDVINEVTRQIGVVQRQAKKAERYRKLSEEMRLLERRAAEHKYVSLCRAEGEIGTEAESSKVNETALSSRLATLEAGIESERAALLDEERELSLAQEEVFKTEGNLRENENRLERIRKDIETAAARNMESASRVEELERRIKEELAEEARVKESEAGLAEMLAVHGALKAEQESQLKKIREESSTLNRGVEEHKSRLISVLTQQARQSNHRQHLEARREEMIRSLSKAEVEREGLERSLAEANKRREGISEKLGKSKQLVLDLGRREESLKQSLVELRSQAAQAEARSMALKEDLALKRSRLSSLTELQESYEGFQKGVRSVMSRKSEKETSGIDHGIFGLVADIIETTPAYETAVESVLGDSLQYVIVKGHDEGIEAIDWLKKSAEGRSTFIPMNLKRYENGGGFPKGDGIIGAAKDLISYDPRYEPVVDCLLGDAVMVDTLGNALTIWAANGYRKTLVTLDGDVINASGVVSGGKVEGVETGFLARKREIKSLQKCVKDIEAETRLSSERLQKIKGEIAQSEAALENLRRDGHEAELSALGTEKELSRDDDEIQRIQERLKIAGFEMEQARRVIKEADDSIEAAVKETGRLESEKSVLEGKVNETVQEQSRVRELERMHEAELASIKVREAGDEERLRGARNTLERLGRDVRMVQNEINSLHASITSNNMTIAGLKVEAKDRESGMGGLVSGLSGLKNGLGARRSSYSARTEELRRSDEEIRRVRSELNSTRDSLNGIMIRMKEMELEKAHMAEVCRDRFDADFSALGQNQETGIVPLSEEEEARLAQLRTMMDEMGEINLLAIKEFEELTARKEFLSTHRDDLNRSLESLQRAIQKINRTSRERFIQTFEQIDTKFKEIFPRLFNGGRAGLRLMDEKDVLESGVDIFAQPPGKKLQSIDLLSGGEKALTAIALIFSIFLIKPSPFCMMDEVDAPLDDANIGRFLSMLKELSANSQFIVITHNKRSMEIANKLYGVTMEEPGISKIISMKVKLEEVTAAA